jgi:peptidoglycan/LPS O-acetylase OafA/YrhL
MSLLKKIKDDLWSVPPHQIISLDILRAMAIILVVFNHSEILFTSFVSKPFSGFRLPLVHSGWVGVQLFFVLSGFLIGYQLWKELEEKRSIDLKTFMIKRSFRIWPLFYFLSFLFLSIRGPIRENATFADLYFLSNYLTEDTIKGSWSLSVEEQFYIISPLLMIIFAKFKELKLRHFRYFLWFILLMAPVVRYLVLFLKYNTITPPTPMVIKSIYKPLHTNFDSLILGLILANLKVENKLKNLKVGGCLFLFVAVSLGFRIYFKNLFNYSLIAGVFAFLVWLGLYCEETVKKYFNWKFFTLIAKLSFGIYLWHIFLGKRVAPFISESLGSQSDLMKYTMFFISYSFLAVVMASITFVVIEKPFLRIRNRVLKNDH